MRAYETGGSRNLRIGEKFISYPTVNLGSPTNTSGFWLFDIVLLWRSMRVRTGTSTREKATNAQVETWLFSGTLYHVNIANVGQISNGRAHDRQAW